MKQGEPTDEERFAEWRRFIEASHDDTVRLFWNRKLFRAVHKMFETNPELAACGGHVWDWVSTTYARDAAMLVRRELDKQKNVLNLRNLLHEIEDHADVLATQRQGAKSPDAATVRNDRMKLEDETATVREFAERLVAHRTPTVDVTITFADLDHAVRAVLHTMRKYYACITASDLLCATPVAQFDWLSPFSIPWLPDGFIEPDDDEEFEG